MITINLEDDGISNSEAWTFAQFLKRVTWEGVRECAVDKEETQYMIDIIERIRSQLEKQGIAPR